MDEFFERIVKKLREGHSISAVTKELKNNIINKSIDVSSLLNAFIEFLRNNFLNENNRNTFNYINSYFNNQMSLDKLSQEIFLKKVLIDDDKREGHVCQFRHKSDETFLDEIFRVFYEFTRSDLKKPKGVCYDFCLFVVGLSLAKKDNKHFYIWNSIEKNSGENNYILFCVEDGIVTVYDPFNNVYLPLDKYSVASFGFKIIELSGNNLLELSRPLTGFYHDIDSIYNYEQVCQFFKYLTNDIDKDLELLKSQNYYERLGINIDASFEEIKVAFKRVVAKYHPDTHPNDKDATEKTQLIIEAYDCLKSEVLRHEYDFKVLGIKKEDCEVVENQANVVVNSNFDGELEKFIRFFKRKYGVSTYESILATLTRDVSHKLSLEIYKYDLIYNNIINIDNNINFQFNLKNIPEEDLGKKR